MTNRILGSLAVVTLAGFLGILIWEVPRLDLGAVVAITLLFAAYDLLVRGKGGSG